MQSNLDKFIQLMKNRLVMGSFRYGLLADKLEYDYYGYLKVKLARYQATGNLEMLVDVANMALLCYTFPPRERIPATTFEWLRRRLLAATVSEPRPAPDILYQTEWNFEFERLLRAGLPTSSVFVKIAYDAWLEFESPEHPKAHWHAVDGQHQGAW